MTLPRIFTSVRNLSNLSNPSISWKPTGKLQQTLGSEISRCGTALHSGASTTAKLFPAMAGEGRFFVFSGSSSASDDRRFSRIPASIDSVSESALCTTLSGDADGVRVRTVEHLLSALEAAGVDNCGIEISGGDEVPLLDGSARGWMEAIEEAGLCVAKDQNGNNMEKLAPCLNEPVNVWKNDSFIAAFPSPKVHITYGIDFPQVTAIGRQWFSCSPLDDSVYAMEISSSRTFCIYEESSSLELHICNLVYDVHFLFSALEYDTSVLKLLRCIKLMLTPLETPSVLTSNVSMQVEKLRKAGLIQGGSLENAIVCSISTGWLNPPLHFHDEPCRHKMLDLIGDLSLFSKHGHQGLPVAHLVAYKAGHALHAELVRRLSGL